jgi:hypothetical protein
MGPAMLLGYEAEIAYRRERMLATLPPTRSAEPSRRAARARGRVIIALGRRPWKRASAVASHG